MTRLWPVFIDSDSFVSDCLTVRVSVCLTVWLSACPCVRVSECQCSRARVSECQCSRARVSVFWSIFSWNFMIFHDFDHFWTRRCTRSSTTVYHQGPHRVPPPHYPGTPPPGTTHWAVLPGMVLPVSAVSQWSLVVHQAPLGINTKMPATVHSHRDTKTPKITENH